jgi:phage/plasmid-associated DNA primase
VFRVSFADSEDRELGDKLANESEGILAWLVDYLALLEASTMTAIGCGEAGREPDRAP